MTGTALTALTAAICCAVAAAAGTPGTAASSRLARLRGNPPFGQGAAVAGQGRERRPRPVLLAGAAGLATLVLAGVLAGPVVGLAAALAAVSVGLVRYRSAPAGRRASGRVRADLPAGADLFAACLLAGSTPQTAVGAVAEALDGPLADCFSRVHSLLELGADPVDAWARAADTEPELAPLAAAVANGAETGRPLADTVTSLATRLRGRARARAKARVRRAGVLVTAPLGLCFLPAFVLVGVVPVVIGLADGFLG